MFSKFVVLLRTFGGRIMVGKDKYGNFYYRKPEKGGKREKRWVEFHGEEDPTKLPVEWSSWLSGTRKEAPTLEEIMRWEAQRRHVKMQAELLKKEDEKQRFRKRAAQNADGSAEDMGLIMRQIDAGEASSSQPGRAEADKPSHDRYTRVRDVRESAEPTTWQPRGNSLRGGTGAQKGFKDIPGEGPPEPQGKREDFQPDTWKP